MLLDNAAQKYGAFAPIHLPDRKWPQKALTKPPRWLSTDLRDGNQALVQPMDSDAKLRYFHHLVKLGYKEIEISYPSASQTEYDFTRRLITTPGAVPDDVWLQVMAPCREELIRTTIEAARGAKKVIVHIHLSTSDCFRRTVFNMTEEETIDLAVRCTRLIRELTKDSADPEIRETEWTLEFTPENFQDTSLEFALEVCEAVKAAWLPEESNPIIFNLAATVEVAMPNIFADQIEYFCSHISEREKVCVSLHNHNDRGCAVAATEMAQLAGADRVEGCLFGNGERTGNVDLVTLALNLYTQGVCPGIDFSNVNEVVEMVEELTRIPVHFRAPYAGRYTFCTFTGTHQDAIRKGYKARQTLGTVLGCEPKWVMPYLPMDPVDLGREHEAIIRINSQSGKGGIGWYVKEVFGFDMPRDLEIAFTRVVKAHANDTGLELTHNTINQLFRSEYMLSQVSWVKVLDVKASSGKSLITGSHGVAHACKNGDADTLHLQATLLINRVKHDIRGCGRTGAECVVDAVQQLGVDLDIQTHEMQYVSCTDGLDDSKGVASFVKVLTKAGCTYWGVGIRDEPEWALLEAILSAATKSKTAGLLVGVE
ncbi:2-isopropylmalate synthase [Cytospora mali]|uniref:2-isopropylmalate synthase n=1 Tax=Cytospora mali TaxID=578113 RepID=A0A194V434_CYTMA|nr:2-isopropylmalate synthase [Valsa mali var. pyri (nom. inval.)]